MNKTPILAKVHGSLEIYFEAYSEIIEKLATMKTHEIAQYFSVALFSFCMKHGYSVELYSTWRKKLIVEALATHLFYDPLIQKLFEASGPILLTEEELDFFFEIMQSQTNNIATEDRDFLLFWYTYQATRSPEKNEGHEGEETIEDVIEHFLCNYRKQDTAPHTPEIFLSQQLKKGISFFDPQVRNHSTHPVTSKAREEFTTLKPLEDIEPHKHEHVFLSQMIEHTLKQHALRLSRYNIHAPRAYTAPSSKNEQVTELILPQLLRLYNQSYPCAFLFHELPEHSNKQSHTRVRFHDEESTEPSELNAYLP